MAYASPSCSIGTPAQSARQWLGASCVLVHASDIKLSGILDHHVQPGKMWDWQEAVPF